MSSERCEMEGCPFWTGHGCACEVMDFDPARRLHPEWCKCQRVCGGDQ